VVSIFKKVVKSAPAEAAAERVVVDVGFESAVKASMAILSKPEVKKAGPDMPARG
jgi:hypothetical protein